MAPGMRTLMSRGVAYATLLAFLASTALVWARPASALSMKRETLTITSDQGKTEFSTEVALSPAEQELGLMYRTNIGDTDGMLFIYTKPQTIQMWMHNTYVPLDMVFINADAKVLRIEENAQPLSDRVISSGAAATAVLELKAGTAERLGLKPGNVVQSPSLSLAH
jgi:uncharacterized protein